MKTTAFNNKENRFYFPEVIHYFGWEFAPGLC
jgi:hypothetical protein